MKHIAKQKGIALLVFATVLAAAASTVTIKALNHSSGNTQIARDKITAAALAQAKDALIGYAITYGDTHSGNVHGFLPCPDQAGGNHEGSAEPVCGLKDVSIIGRLPWKTLDLPPLRGGDGECLWYAVSGTYKNSPKTGLMNWDTNGQLRVYASDGTTLLTPADNQAVAVIFAPGIASPGQNRTPATNTSTCGDNYTASNYLDNDTVHLIDNADIATGKFIQSHEDRDANGNILLTVNDRMVFITKQDIWNAMQKRKNFLATLDSMTMQTALCIANFGRKNQISGTPNILNKSLPWPAQRALSDYTDNTQYNDHDGLYTGRTPYRVNTSRGPTHNLISSDYLLRQGTCDASGINCVNNCLNPDEWAAIYPWWNNWKDHLFYAISQRFKPDSSSTNACDSNHCLSVNDSSGLYHNNAAVIIFAGKKLSDLNQTRANKSVVDDYLEGSNATNMGGSHLNGNENYQVDASATFNDIVYCIKQDLTAVKGNPLATPACPP